MKILHIWDCAGVANVLAKYQRLQGHTVKVITHSRYDYFHINEFYQSEQFTGSAFRYKMHVLKESLKYDIIHVHALYQILPQLRMLNPHKRIIMHYHGTDARKEDRRKNIYNKFANQVLVSTIDLVPLVPTSTWLPIPVDTEHFQYGKFTLNGKWLSIFDTRSFHTNIPKGMKVELMDRNTNMVYYRFLPDFLSKYEGYIDIKEINGSRLKSLSATGLQCLSMGMYVMDYREDISRTLPEIHYPERVLELLNRIYGI